MSNRYVVRNSPIILAEFHDGSHDAARRIIAFANEHAATAELTEDRCVIISNGLRSGKQTVAVGDGDMVYIKSNDAWTTFYVDTRPRFLLNFTPEEYELEAIKARKFSDPRFYKEPTTTDLIKDLKKGPQND